MATITESSINEMVSKAAHLLPSQAPLHAFVHHNTLHAFEHLKFKEALKAASQEFDAQPFMSERQYLDAARNGRILQKDIESVLEREVQDLDALIFPGAPSRRAILLWRLDTLFSVPNQDSVSWWLHEKGYLEKPHYLAGTAANSPASALFFHNKRKYLPSELRSLWNELQDAAPLSEHRYTRVRPRDYLLSISEEDLDEYTKPVLIRCAGSYLDQGVGTALLPNKETGFLSCFRNLYSLGLAPLPWWLKGMRKECILQAEAQYSAAQTIANALEYFCISAEYQQKFITESLKMLRGWAGMFHLFETQPEKTPVNPYPATLIDYLAVQLTLEKIAFSNVSKRIGVTRNSFAEYLKEHGHGTISRSKSVQDIYESFITAQAFNLPVGLFFDPENSVKWVEEIGQFDSFERRYLLQLAYEKTHRDHVLDGLIEHRRVTALEKKGAENSAFQAVFCMDEREESTRRHLEEIEPEAQTYGFAGFFGVAMQYQGLDDVTSRPLCPVNRVPAHFIKEYALNDTEFDHYRKWRKFRGTYSQRTLQNESLISFGPFWSLLMGVAKSPSLIFRSLFPVITEKTKNRFRSFGPSRPKTRLRLFRENGAEKIKGFYQGYSIEEAADVVYGTLAAMGLRSQFSPFVLIVGHGSSSLNNPHEAAHDCGATGGGRGGPNARAFAMMANEVEVRKKLATRGIDISQEVVFLGAYHNTCDDSIEYYDTDLIPETHIERFRSLKANLALACKLDALERCRKFEEVPVSVSAEKALEYAYQHSIDLAQPRPEYGHATNAVCMIGRRETTRGLFLDRRSFLISYDPGQDSDKSIIANILESAGPVGAGINLEYYFSFVDPIAYGCNTKLPHNISALIGVMEGHSSDLRTGLPWQMVEIHEPVRLLTIVEATPQELLAIAGEREVVGNLVANEWIQLVSLNPESGEFMVYSNGEFVKHEADRQGFPTSPDSETYFRGSESYLGLAHIGLMSEARENA